ncbi:hypothetical protein SDC9_182162 [bioreactor metagenome]|uniref:Uncharacterized protein n=1 Tax=bioreactor metagenome TaxID=1076179 RepID=A0A645H6R0_9ZZZZ
MACTIPAIVLKVIDKSRITITFSLVFCSMSLTSHLFQLRVKRLAQTVGEHVEAEHQQRQYHNGGDDLVRVRGKAVKRITDQ